MSSSGICANGAVTNASPLESEIKKFVMQMACPKSLIIDSSKFGKSALVSYAKLSDFENLITFNRPAGAWSELIDSSGVKCICT